MLIIPKEVVGTLEEIQKGWLSLAVMESFLFIFVGHLLWIASKYVGM